MLEVEIWCATYPHLNFQICVIVASVSYLARGYGSKCITDFKFTLKFTLTFASAFLFEVINLPLALVAQLDVHPAGDQEIADTTPAALATFFHAD